MKKGFILIFTRMFFAIILFTLTTLGQQVYASQYKTYNISRYDINILINSDGSANFEERLTYYFSGQFSGVTRDVDFSLTKGIKDKRVYVLENDILKELYLNSGNSLDTTGKSGTYNFMEEGNLGRFKIFESSQNLNKTFVVKYKLIDAVTKYKDTAEFNRKVVGTEWQTRLNNIKIKITVPHGATKEELKVFSHGPLIGESSILDSNNVEFNLPTVSQETFVETLVLFPVKLVSKSSNIVAENALPRIMANESILADEANKTREEARQAEITEKKLIAQYDIETQKNADKIDLILKRMRSVGNPLIITLILLWFPINIYLYIKYDKELAHSFKGKYYRELPGEYTPGEMSVLMSSSKVKSRDIMATIMDLTRKRHLVISSKKINKKGFFGSKEIIQYVITLKKNVPTNSLKAHETFLISWFIIKIGNGNYVTLDQIKDYAKKKYKALQFKADYDKWNRLACEEATKNNFFYKTNKKSKVLGIVIGLLYFLIGIVVMIIMLLPIAIACIIQGLILVVFSMSIKKRTEYGNEQYEMWKAFKHFLKDFSRLDKAEIPAIVIWEHYLVYAISLGISKKVIKQLPIVFRDEDLKNDNLTYMYGTSYGYFATFGAIFDDTIHTVNGAISTARSISTSINSSSSGGGGGFSGGSSGGGGGAGGGGAF